MSMFTENTAYALNQPLSRIPLIPIQALQDPTVRNKAPLGTLWVNKLTNEAWILTSIENNEAQWQPIVADAGEALTMVATQTNDAAAHNLLTVPMAANSALTFHGVLTAANAGFTQQLGRVITIAAIRAGGAPALSGNPAIDHFTTNPLANGVTAVPAINGNNFEINVTGAAATIWNWKLIYYMSVLP